MLILEGSKIMSFSDIFGSIIQTFDTIFVYINTAIYDLISFLYQIFIALSSAEIFTAEQYKNIASRIYIVIGVAALFIISYGLLRAIIDPDNAGKSETSPTKIVPNVIKAVVLVAFTPAIFNLAYRMQEAVVGSDVIPRIIMGNNYAGDVKAETPDGETVDFKFSYKESGRTFANTIFLQFFHPKQQINEDGSTTGVENKDVQIVDCYFGFCGGINPNTPEAARELEKKKRKAWLDDLGNYMLYSWRMGFGLHVYPVDEMNTAEYIERQEQIAEEYELDKAYSFEEAIHDVDIGFENFNVYANFANLVNGKDGQKMMEYHGIFQLIVGIFVIYIFINFCIDFGVRAVKLGYFQLIAPIPIFTLMIPGQKKVFDNWLKASISTYLDIFIRIAVIFFGLLMINELPNIFNSSSLWGKSLFEANSGVQNFAKVFLIVGILIFMKQAPKLISDIFGISGSPFKLGLKDKFNEAFDWSKAPVVGKAQGALTGAAGAAWTAAINRGNRKDVMDALRIGALKGGKSGGLQFSNQRENMWSDTYKLKGPAGLLGGRTWYSSTLSELENRANDNFLQYDEEKGLGSNSQRIRAIEGSRRFKNMRDANTAEIRAALGDLASAEEPHMERIRGLNANLEAQNATLSADQASLDGVNEQYNQLLEDTKNKYLGYLKNMRDRAMEIGDSAQVEGLNAQINEALNGNANKEIMNYMQDNMEDDYNTLQGLKTQRNTLNQTIESTNRSIEQIQRNIDAETEAMNTDQNIIDARKALNKFTFYDEKGNKITDPILSAEQISREIFDSTVFQKTRSDLIKASDEYKWRVEAETKERKEAAISEAKGDATLQAQAELLGAILKQNNGGNGGNNGDKK